MKITSVEIELIPSGEREVVTVERATEIVAHWQTQWTFLMDTMIADASVVKMTAIDLSNKSYTLEGAKVVTSYFKSNPALLASVTTANLSDMIASRMEEEGLAVLGEFSSVVSELCPSLTSLDLSDNAMGSKGVTACESLFTSLPYLSEVKLQNNGLAEHTMDQVVELMIKEAASDADADGSSSSNIASRLRSIHFFNNMSGAGGCAAFAKLLALCSPDLLTTIRFSGTRADRPGTLAVVKAMHQHMLPASGSNSTQTWNVTHLDLADNAFGCDEGGDVLASVLERCPCLNYLNIRDCCLDSPEMMTKICQALITSGCPLEFLDVSGNDITYSTVTDKRGLALLLTKKASSLQTLNVEENELTSRGVAHLAKVVGNLISTSAASASSSNVVLSHINMATNMCGSSGAKAWTELKIGGKCPSTLGKLNLDGNMIPEKVVRELEEAYGNILVELVDNEGDEGDDADGDLSDLDSDDDDDEEEENQESAAVDSLATELKSLNV
jgi:Ran GTPase-activating protein 1